MSLRSFFAAGFKWSYIHFDKCCAFSVYIDHVLIILLYLNTIINIPFVITKIYG